MCLKDKVIRRKKKKMLNYRLQRKKLYGGLIILYSCEQISFGGMNSHIPEIKKSRIEKTR